MRYEPQKKESIAALCNILGVAVFVLILTFMMMNTVAAQVAPPAFATTDAPGAMTGPTELTASTILVQFSAAQLPFLSPGQQITAVSFRLEGNELPVTITYPNYRVQVSQAANSITSMSTSFAANQLNPVTVYDAPLTFDAASMPTGNSPNAFGPTITFSTPYTYQGGDLVLYFTHPTGSGPDSVTLDAATAVVDDSGYRLLGRSGENAATGTFTARVVVTQFSFLSAAVAPEPGTLFLLAMGVALPAAGMALRRSRE